MGVLPFIDKPFAFFGHSFGALLSFELSRRLRRRNLNLPSHLFVSGRNSPEAGPSEKFHDLPKDKLKGVLQRLGGTPLSLLKHAEFMDLAIPILRADFSANDSYVYMDEPPLDIPIIAIMGIDDRSIEKERFDLWARQTACSFRKVVMPGDHFYLRTAQREIQKLIEHTLCGPR